MYIKTSRVQSFILRALIFVIIWWVVTDANMSSWWIGIPAVVIALIASNYLMPVSKINWYELYKFAPRFIILSIVGGVDVARRALHPKLQIVPALIEYPSGLPIGLPQVFFINAVSLLPGTLIADVHGNVIKAHILDDTSEIFDELRSIEQSIAKIFVVTLDERENNKGN